MGPSNLGLVNVLDSNSTSSHGCMLRLSVCIQVSFCSVLICGRVCPGITGFSLLFASVFVEVLVPVFRDRIRLAPVDISRSVCGRDGGGEGAMLLARDHGFTDLGDVPVSDQLAAAEADWIS